jgi:hypothetical protein
MIYIRLDNMVWYREIKYRTIKVWQEAVNKIMHKGINKFGNIGGLFVIHVVDIHYDDIEIAWDDFMFIVGFSPSEGHCLMPDSSCVRHTKRKISSVEVVHSRTQERHQGGGLRGIIQEFSIVSFTYLYRILTCAWIYDR